jgi:membrane protease YdiL (CAAX protease family)
MARDARTPAWSLIAFFAVTFAITWPCFLSVGHLSSVPRTLVLYLGIFAPAIVAIGLTALLSGGEGVGTLLRRLFRGDVGARWYLFAVGYMAAIKLTVALVFRVLTGAWPRFGTESWVVTVAATLASTLIGGQAGEEIGWRGFALPRLAERLGLPLASLLLGLIWALWHLPLFFVAGADKHGQSFVVYAVQVVALCVAISWLYLRTGGSLLLTMLMHSAINQTKDIVPSITPGATSVFALRASPVAWLTALLLWVCAAWFLTRMARNVTPPATG